ncbi:FtsK/SpoIIIE domain-containing protein [Streptomyces sp. ODS28]|uniref:FtsK/SpoIIIE domain-containing protein n=1 Tax=Streptomyces sp. ODS28 TaxID=3136688 RepID=UPI0031F06AC2
MRLNLTVVDPLAGSSADLVLDAAPESRMSDVARELSRCAVGGSGAPDPNTSGGAQVIPMVRPGAPNAVDLSAPALYVDGTHVDPAMAVAASPLRDGAVVSLHDPVGSLPGEPFGLAELRVAGGPQAGAVHRLGPGRYDIGRSPACPIRIDEPEMPERALGLSIAPDGTCSVLVYGDEEAKKKVRVDGKPLETDELPLGAQLAVGNTLLEVARYTPPDAALKWSEDGAGLDYNRPPRLRPPQRPTRFTLPSPPGEFEARPLPWLMALSPLVMAVTMALVMGRWYYLIMAVLSPLIFFANHYYDKRHGRKSHTKQLKEYNEHKERIERDAQEALVLERLDRRHSHPDPGTVLSVGSGPRTRLWERRRSDEDHLLLRFGTGKLPSTVVLDDPERDDHKRQVTWNIQDTAVTLSLAELGVVGLAGPDDTPQSLARWVVAQSAVLHSPLDVQFYVLTDAEGREGWEWVRWLPHTGPSGGHDTNVLLGNDAETVGARIGELVQILDARKKAAEENKAGRGDKPSFADPDIVVVWDGSRRLRSMPGVVRLFQEGPTYSMYAVCVDAEERFLPSECKGVVVAEPRTGEHAEHEKDDSASEPAKDENGSSKKKTRRERRREGRSDSTKHSGKQQVGAAATHPPLPYGAFPSFDAWGASAASAPAEQTEAGEPLLRLRVEQVREARIMGVRPDFVSPSWCTRVARALSPLRDISGETEDAALPASSRLLDVIEMEPPTGEAVSARWQLGGQSTVAVVGESYDGPFGIDIRKDGPHGLIAGTTGSGKSELLQTIVAALAVANTPENMTFVLVDYKGGSAFKDCVNLPHTVGMVTDLDAHLVERALESLGAELHRREKILAAADAKDIEDYQDLVRRDPSHQPVPRLLLVIDEFASMVRDLPDFVTGLVNIAQRGRSLGIHLMLATQRPSGVVSSEIRANTNLRIALRVTDGAESADVIDSPEAGNISKNTPGRAYVRTGAASLIPFQSGRVGGRRPGAENPQATAPWAGLLGWHELGRAQVNRPPSEAPEEEEITDLKVLVDAVREANSRLGIPRQHSPWLPALGETVLLDELDSGAGAGQLPPAPYGIEDLPASQARRPVVIDFATFGHLLFAGAPRSGRSQVLRTIAGSLARTHSCADVHIYGIDCGNGALNAFTKLPHCGAVIGRNQTERAVRFINRMSGETTRRQELLAEHGFADIGEQRGAAPEDERLPHIVIFLDRWEGWLPTLGEMNHGELTDELTTLMREGASVGIHLVIAGDRQLFAGRISSLTEDKYALRLADRGDFSLIDIAARKVPDEIPPGRGFYSETATETQFALLSEDASGQGQNAALAAIGEAAAQRDAEVAPSRRPFRVDSLPSRISFADAWELRDAEAARSPLWSLIGVGGDQLTGFGPDLSQGIPSFVIAGPSRSGRSTVLINVARTYLARGVRLVVAAPRSSPLRELQGQEGVLEVFTEDEIEDDELTGAVESASPEQPIVIVIDDGEMLRDCDAEDEFKKLIQTGSERGIGIVIAGDEEDVCSGFSGWQADLRKGKRGILLSPQDSSSGELIGVRISRGSVGGPVVPGKGLMHLGDGEPFTVTVPM